MGFLLRIHQITVFMAVFFSKLLQIFYVFGNFARNLWRFSKHCAIIIQNLYSRLPYKGRAAGAGGIARRRGILLRRGLSARKGQKLPMKKRVLLCLIALFKVLYGAVYAPLKLLPMQRKVVMISRQSNKPVSYTHLLKRVYRYPDRLVLQPENPAFPPIVLVGEEINTVTIEGKAVGLCRNL